MSAGMDENALWLSNVSPEELRRIINVLYRVHRFISVITDLDTLLEQVMEESKEVADAEACSLMLYDPKQDELYFHVALGESGDQQALKREIRLSLGQGIAGAAAASRHSVNVPDVRTDPRFYRSADEVTQFESRSILAVPLLDHDKLVGVLEVLNKRGGGAFTDADLHVMEIFSSLVATSIANARLIEENLRTARLAAIGEAVAGLSHFTKNILTGMGGSIDLIDQALKSNQVESLQRCWPVLKRSTTRIADLVEDMLAFSKEREPLRHKCAIEAVVKDAVDTFYGLLVRKQVAVDVDTAGVTGPAYVDARGILRCLINLLSNASDAVPPENGRVWVKAYHNGCGALLLEVADNGAGVPEELRQQVFEPFFSTKGTRGTGLGLAVTCKIVREHGGTLSIKTREGGGALFQIVLPAVQERE